jgi:chorismate lyase
LLTYLHHTRELHWFDGKRLLKSAPISSNLRQWILDKGSLTAKLLRLSEGEFHVQVLRQINTRVGRSEALALGIKPSQLTLVREVVLMGHNRAWVFARSILPLSSLTGRLRHLRKQGNRPLGAFLFNQPQLKRSPIAVAHISRHHHYVPAELLDEQKNVWGRRSIFDIDGKKLLVSEVFLSRFPC